jgi:hypothetical protein
VPAAATSPPRERCHFLYISLLAGILCFGVITDTAA